MVGVGVGAAAFAPSYVAFLLASRSKWRRIRCSDGRRLRPIRRKPSASDSAVYGS